MPVCIPPPQAVELGQRLSEVLCVFPAEIRLLQPPTPAPDAPLGRGSINDRVLVQDLIIRGHHEASCTDNTVRGNPHSVVHARARRDRVEVAHARRFDAYVK